MRHLKSIVTAAVLTLAASGVVLAQAQPSKAEQALKYRKAVYQAIAWNFAPMGAMAQGKAPFDAADFATRAGRVAALSPMLAESYSADTQNVAGSKAKADLWSNRAEFDALMQDLVDASATLAKVAAGGNEAQTKAAFFDTANTCKACHDKFKAD